MADNLYVKIKKLREKNGFSQEYLAKQLGISRPTFILIEEGKRELTISELKKLAAILNISLEEFLFNKKKGIEISIKLERKQRKTTKRGVRINVPQKKLDKFKEVLLYVLEKIGAKPNVGETVLYKLLYFIDFDFYEKYEEQLIGATYIKNYHGPTPIEFKPIVEEMGKKGEIEKVRSKYFQYDQKKYLPRRKPDLSRLNAQEIKHIDEVLARLSNKNAQELSDYSHNDVPWITTEDGKPIEYEAVFYRSRKTSVRSYEDNEL